VDNLDLPKRDNLTIDFCTRLYPPDYSGAGTQVRALATFMAAHDADIRVLSSADDRHWRQRRTSDGPRVFRIKLPTRGRRGALRFGLWAGLRARRRAIWYVVGAGPQLWPLLTFAWLKKARVVFKASMAGHDDGLTLLSGRFGSVRRRLLRSVRQFITISTDLHRTFLDSELAPVTTHIPNGVDTSRFHPARSPEEKLALRISLDIPPTGLVVLFSAT
jgi:glycosyltransferase involved in cell wall biosynthesis